MRIITKKGLSVLIQSNSFGNDHGAAVAWHLVSEYLIQAEKLIAKQVLHLAVMV